MNTIVALLIGFLFGYIIAGIIGIMGVNYFAKEAKRNMRRTLLDCAIIATHPVPDGPLKSDWEDVIKMINNESKRK